MKSNRNSEVNLKNITAVIFDTDGVLTDTVSIHAQAWKQLFDEYLKKRSERQNEVFQPFNINSDYLILFYSSILRHNQNPYKSFRKRATRVI